MCGIVKVDFLLYENKERKAYISRLFGTKKGTFIFLTCRRKHPLSVSLCLMVRNEEQALPGCLQSVAGIADEIIVADAGSDGPDQRSSGQFRALDIKVAQKVLGCRS